MGLSRAWLGITGADPPRLVCFPHAGGAAAGYLRLARRATPDPVVIRMPGRPPRINEPPVSSLAEAANLVADEIRTRCPRPVVFWGHSFGAALAWEVAVALADETAVDVIVLTGRDAPGRRSEERHRWSDERLLDHLRTLGGTPQEVLDDDELRVMMLDQLRSDLTLLAAHRPDANAIAGVRLICVGGTTDPSTTLDGLAAWAARTRAGCEVRLTPGGHFFPWQGDAFVDILCAALDDERG